MTVMLSGSAADDEFETGRREVMERWDGITHQEDAQI